MNTKQLVNMEQPGAEGEVVEALVLTVATEDAEKVAIQAAMEDQDDLTVHT